MVRLLALVRLVNSGFCKSTAAACCGLPIRVRRRVGKAMRRRFGALSVPRNYLKIGGPFEGVLADPVFCQTARTPAHAGASSHVSSSRHVSTTVIRYRGAGQDRRTVRGCFPESRSKNRWQGCDVFAVDCQSRLRVSVLLFAYALTLLPVVHSAHEPDDICRHST